MSRRITAALAAVVVVAACQGPATSPRPTVSSGSSPLPPVTIGVGTDIPGLALFNPDTQERRGFDVDLYRWLANNTEPKFTPVEVSVLIGNRVDELTLGRVQLVVHGFSITDKRREEIGFAGPYLISQQGFLVRAGEEGTVRSLDDLVGKNLCTQAGSTSLSQLTLGPLKSKVTVTSEVGTRQCVDRLLREEVDAVSTDQIILLGFARQDPGVRVVPLTFGTQERYGIGLPKGDRAQCERMTQGIREFITNGYWDQFFRSNFGDLPPEGYRPDPYHLDPCR
ncbi:transporter substrate-binding domain-containing protein [Actinosynnema sp. NPDC023587]|uniref:transporter substrate-binding domain-containing protein n=1 Tax=Actinosynnema sp. NPDC023587 TaxID=3154695 RepID=UPI0033DC8FEA